MKTLLHYLREPTSCIDKHFAMLWYQFLGDKYYKIKFYYINAPIIVLIIKWFGINLPAGLHIISTIMSLAVSFKRGQSLFDTLNRIQHGDNGWHSICLVARKEFDRSEWILNVVYMHRLIIAPLHPSTQLKQLHALVNIK